MLTLQTKDSQDHIKKQRTYESEIIAYEALAKLECVQKITNTREKYTLIDESGKVIIESGWLESPVEN